MAGRALDRGCEVRALSRRVITLTTDFGNGSPYVAAMKGVILSLQPEAYLVDLTHDVPPQDIHQAALILADVAPRFPGDSIHVAVVDPGVGTEREVIYAEIDGRHYVAPDNGVLSRLVLRCPASRMFALTESAYWLPEVSSTFHGRDIMAPVAAHLSRGLEPARLGPARQNIVQLSWREAQRMPKKISGEIQAIDSFGNLITNITADQLTDVPTDEGLSIVCSEHETRGLFRAYADQPEMTLIALLGSSGQLELAIVGDSAAAMLGVGVGEPVTLSW